MNFRRNLEYLKSLNRKLFSTHSEIPSRTHGEITNENFRVLRMNN